MFFAQLFASFLLLPVLSSIASAQPLSSVEVRASPIASFSRGSTQTRFGDLVFRGGLELGSLNTDFGSLSGLDFLPDGQTLVAVSDTGFWFSTRIRERRGTLTGIEDARLGPLLLENGRPPATKIHGDAEGLRIVRENGSLVAYVSFEQTAAVRRYSGPDFMSSHAERLKLPYFVRAIRRNQGLESIAIAPAGSPLDGTIVVIAELSLDEAGNHRGFIISGRRQGQFTILRSDDFDVTDAAFLTDGDLLILERRFSFSRGVAIRIRRIASGDIRAGSLAKPVTVMEAGGGHEIDNLEGMAVRERGSETIITLVSDNNGSLFQRTLLLQFALIGEILPTGITPPLPRPRPSTRQ